VPLSNAGSDLLSRFPRPLLLGHRGAKNYAPENTLEAFELALQHGCDGFEFDVRLTTDQQAVICHDPKFNRFEVAKSDRTRLPSLPTLETVLQRFADRAFLDIELKVLELERITLELIDRYKPSLGYVITSFLPEVLQRLHALNSNVPIGLICGNRKQLEPALSLPLACIVLHRSLGGRELANSFHVRGIPVFVFGANRPREMRSIVERGVEALIIDDTRLAFETFRGRTQAAGNP
jgi:glycerophosphoryl diester phosphodiesterase